eukprot:SAG31_NODE_947_length_10828_cov_3.713953_9_plen_114_part_00
MAFERAGGLDKVYGQITEEEQRLRIEEERREMELEAVEERNLKGFEPSIEARSRSAQLRSIALRTRHIMHLLSNSFLLLERSHGANHRSAILVGRMAMHVSRLVTGSLRLSAT